MGHPHARPRHPRTTPTRRRTPTHDRTRKHRHDHRRGSRRNHHRERHHQAKPPRNQRLHPPRRCSRSPHARRAIHQRLQWTHRTPRPHHHTRQRDSQRGSRSHPHNHPPIPQINNRERAGKRTGEHGGGDRRTNDLPPPLFPYKLHATINYARHHRVLLPPRSRPHAPTHSRAPPT